MQSVGQADILRDAKELQALLLDFGRRRSFRDPVALALEEMQFTPAQVHSLLWLGTEGSLTMGELATRLGITEKTVTGVVDRLEAGSYVHRERSAQDRRVIRVRLTRKGTGVYRRFQAALQEKIRRILGLLKPAERRALIRIIGKMLERLSATPDLETPNP